VLPVGVTEDTDIGGAADRFPITRRSAIEAARSVDAIERQRGFEAIIAAYWKPVYKYIRIKWRKPNEDAKDLTQAFFAQALEKRFFDGYDAAKSRFRTFVRVCLDGFIANEEKAAHRMKRGGGVTVLSMDFESAEGELRTVPEPAAQSLDDYFDKEWTRSIFALALESFRNKCESAGKSVQVRLFERYYLNEGDEPKLSYQLLADEFQITTTTVTNYLAFARREFRKALLDNLRAITATEEEFRREARALLGASA
jgi:RNA polymerase sigma factor (sigma-70 family)